MKNIYALSLGLMISMGAIADVATQKAMRSSDEDLKKAEVAMENSCGNQAEVQFHWNIIDNYDITAVGKANHQDDITRATLAGYVGSTAGVYIDQLSRLCEDNDYKEVISKITKINLIPLDSPTSDDRPKNAKVETGDTEITITFNPFSQNSMETYDLLKSAF